MAAGDDPPDRPLAAEPILASKRSALAAVSGRALPGVVFMSSFSSAPPGPDANSPLALALSRASLSCSRMTARFAATVPAAATRPLGTVKV